MTLFRCKILVKYKINLKLGSVSTYDCSTLNTNLTKEKLIDLIGRTFQNKAILTLHVMAEFRFSLRNSRISCMFFSKCM